MITCTLAEIISQALFLAALKSPAGYDEAVRFVTNGGELPLWLKGADVSVASVLFPKNRPLLHKRLEVFFQELLA